MQILRERECASDEPLQEKGHLQFGTAARAALAFLPGSVPWCLSLKWQKGLFVRGFVL